MTLHAHIAMTPPKTTTTAYSNTDAYRVAKDPTNTFRANTPIIAADIAMQLDVADACLILDLPQRIRGAIYSPQLDCQPYLATH